MSSSDTQPRTPRVSRRDFLRAAGSGAVMTGTAAAAVSFTESTAFAQRRWDHEVDIVVVGSGGGAGPAALVAHGTGAQVMVLEKASTWGGTTSRSGSGIWIPNNHLMRAKGYTDPKEDCLKYMARTAYPQLYN